MKKTHLFHRGSALIITMLVVAAISAAAFGLSRIFLADIRISASLEDSMRSFYLSEAGIEEGLLRYRVDRANESGLNEGDFPLRSFGTGNGSYTMSTTFLTQGTHVVDTRTERQDGNIDFEPNGFVPQDRTVEVSTEPLSTGQVNLTWQLEPGFPASQLNPERRCGVEITDVIRGGAFPEKQVVPSPGPSGSSADTGRTAIRVKPLCGDLLWLRFSAGNRIGRTLQIIDSTGTVGRAKRRLEVTVNRSSGQLIGFFDFVIGCGTDPALPACNIIKP